MNINSKGKGEFLSFKQNIVNEDPNIYIIKGTRSDKKSTQLRKSSIKKKIDKVIHLIPQQYVKPQEELQDLVQLANIIQAPNYYIKGGKTFKNDGSEEEASYDIVDRRRKP